MTLSGAGITFIATIDTAPLGSVQRWFLGAALLLLAVSLAAGLMVWSRAAQMLSKKNYNLRDRYLEIPGLINILSFGAGVVSLGVCVAIKLFDPFDYAALMPAH